MRYFTESLSILNMVWISLLCCNGRPCGQEYLANIKLGFYIFHFILVRLCAFHCGFLVFFMRENEYDVNE